MFGEGVLNFSLGFHHQETLRAEEEAKQVALRTAQQRKEIYWGDMNISCLPHVPKNRTVIY
jgi:hypothetical protein